MDEEIERDEAVRVRRTLTMRSNAARQISVNFMPSRQLSHSYNTLRLRRANSEHAALLEEVTDTTDGPSTSTEANVDNADTRADIIVRSMEQHQRLMEDNVAAEGLRREALRDLPQGLTMKRNVRAKLSASVSLRSKRRPISCFRRLKYRIGFAWKRGGDRFRDFLFSIDLWYEAIRQIEGHYGSAVGSYFYFLRSLFAANVLLTTLVVAFVVIPQALHDARGERGGQTAAQGFLHFVSGKGLEHTPMFYGHYHDGEVWTGVPLAYIMPFAYFFTMVCLYLAAFAVLCYRTAYSYRRNFIETAGGLSQVFANKVFCGWDFGIVSPRAGLLNATSVYNEFKELLNEQNKNQTKTTFCVKLGQYLTNILVTTLVLGVIVGLEYGFWRLLSLETVTSQWEVLVSLSVTGAVTLLPVMFNFIVRLEYYKPRTALYVTLARTWLLDIGTFVLLLYYWTESGRDCWETSFGQETFRLVLLDSLVSLFVLPAVEFGRGLLFKLHLISSPPEFNIAYNSLGLIYNQAALWFGLLFSPLLVVCVTIKCLLLFYVKRQCAFRACQPARKIWRASQTQTVLNMLVTLSLFTTLFAFGSLFFRMPSKECGPFRSYEYVYSVLSEGVLRLSHHEMAHGAILFVTRPGVIACLMLSLCVSVYYMRARARAQRSMVELLRHMLVLQAKDREFLLSAIAKVSKGEWLYSPKPDEGPDSHTWKYLQEVRKPSNAGYHLDASRLSQRPRSFAKERPGSEMVEEGDTDSSFSWQGSSGGLDRTDTEAAEGREVNK